MSANETTTPLDERVAFLRAGKTDVLLALIGELVEPASLGCSRNFFMVGIDRRFRATTPEQLFDLIVGVLRERVPNTKPVDAPRTGE